MYSSEDFENFYVRYKAEGLPQGMSIQSWCMKHKVSWNLFNKWYRDTRHRIVPVEVSGCGNLTTFLPMNMGLKVNNY